tara:strand:+ start:609 stop:1199 length:591 start_codon:yes stop_codon:yes gene_type:complete
MYLIHETSEDSLKKILEEGQLKAAYLIENTEDLWCHGAGILYPSNEQKCIFFNVIDSLQKRLLSSTLLYFDSKLLNNRSFYVSGGLICAPDYIKPFNENKKSYNRKKNFHIKYKQHTKNIDIILRNLLDYSYACSKDIFLIYQQIAIKQHCNLNYLKKIRFTGNDSVHKETKALIRFLHKSYPHLICEVLLHKKSK